jgi:hypothetical protein
VVVSSRRAIIGGIRKGDTMSDPQSGSEQPMIPDDLVPRQQSEDPVPIDPSATDDDDQEGAGDSADAAQ